MSSCVHPWLPDRGAGSAYISIHRVLNSKAGEIGEADDASLWFDLSAPSAKSAVEDPGDSESPSAAGHAPWSEAGSLGYIKPSLFVSLGVHSWFTASGKSKGQATAGSNP